MVRVSATASAERDNALVLLRQLTKACLLGATFLLAAFSVIAAVTIPGQTNAAAGGSGPTTANGQVPTENDDGPLQPPVSGHVAPAGGVPAVVTGGSRAR